MSPVDYLSSHPLTLQNILGELPLDIICSSKLSFPQALLAENCLLLRTDVWTKFIPSVIFVPNGGIGDIYIQKSMVKNTLGLSVCCYIV